MLNGDTEEIVASFKVM